MLFPLKLRMIVILMITASIGYTAQAHAEADAGAFDPYATKFMAPEEKVAWHGYSEFEYWDKQGKKKSFDAHKITVWMGVKLNEKAYLSSEIEYEHAPKLGGGDRRGGSGQIKIDSMWLRVTPVDDTVLFAGVFYTMFGIEYLSYPGHKNKLVSRPKVMKSGGIIPGTWSDIGVGVTQTVNGVGQLDVYYINGDALNGGVSRDSSEGGNNGKSPGFRFMFNDFIDGLNFGASYVSGKWDENDLYDSSRYGVHLRVDSDVFSGISQAPVLIAEYVTGTDEGAISLGDEEGAGVRDKKVDGYYIQLSSRVHPVIEVVGRYGEYDNDKDKIDNNKKETSLGMVWHALDGIQVKAEYQWNAEEGRNKENNAAVVELVAFW